MAYTFDGINRLIILTSGTTSFEAQDLYSRWKEWAATDDNTKFTTAFRTIGGDTLGGGVAAGDYYFLNNAEGWRIRPQEADHSLAIDGNLYGEDPALPIFTPTLAAYNVLVTRSLSSLTQTDSTSQVATAILDEPDAVEQGVTVRGALRLILAATAGKVSGGGTNTVTIRNASADTKSRIIATVDVDGNRSAIIYDVSD